MIYHSTRNEQLTASSTHAVLQGIAPDGGLYICDPAALHFDWRAALEKDTLSMAADILHALLPDFENMEQLVRDSYAGKFPTSDLTPLTPVADKYVLELYHGPTSAFKDVALSVLPRLIVAAAKAEGMKGDVVILTATSGDTGKAAMEGFHDVPGTRITVFYPHGGVSAVQQAQMATQEGNNVRVCAVRGNFDDAQTGVKNIFAACKDRDLHGAMLSSANSINIGRLAPQVVYYFRAYGDLVKAGRIRMGDVVDYTVPTGNFGDILAGYFAREMGLPVGRLICASNANDVLTEFLTTGRYDKRRPFYKTTSPSMDILVSSNLERLLYLVSGDAGYVAQLMAQLNEQGWYQASEDILARLQAVFGGGGHWPPVAGAEVPVRPPHRRGVVGGGEPHPRGSAHGGAVHRVALQVPRRRAGRAGRKDRQRRVRHDGAAPRPDRHGHPRQPAGAGGASRAAQERDRHRRHAELRAQRRAEIRERIQRYEHCLSGYGGRSRPGDMDRLCRGERHP